MKPEILRVNHVIFCIFCICLFSVTDDLYRSYILNLYSLRINSDIKSPEQNLTANHERLDVLLTFLDKYRENSYSSFILIDYELWETNEYRESEELYKANPKLFEVLVLKASAASAQQDFEEAVTRYRFALSVKPNEATEWYKLGNVLWTYYLENKASLSDEQAEKVVSEITYAFENSLSIEPFNAEYWDSAGWFYFSVQNEPIIAIEYLRKAVDAQEVPNPWTLFKLALAYRIGGELEQALKTLELAEIYYEGPEVDFLRQIADIQWRMGQYNAAINTNSLAILRQPGCSELYFLQSIYLVSACQIEDAQQTFDEGLLKGSCFSDTETLEMLITEARTKFDNQTCH